MVNIGIENTINMVNKHKLLEKDKTKLEERDKSVGKEAKTMSTVFILNIRTAYLLTIHILTFKAPITTTVVCFVFCQLL